MARRPTASSGGRRPAGTGDCQGDNMVVAIRGERVAFGSDAALSTPCLAGNTGFRRDRLRPTHLAGIPRRHGHPVRCRSADVHPSRSEQGFRQAILTRTGGDGVRYLIAEQKTFNDKTQHSAVLNFDGPRHGLASWLAAPGPMGGLSYVSSRAQFAASVITKDPRQMIEELFALVEAQGPKGREEFDRMQRLGGCRFPSGHRGLAGIGSDVRASMARCCRFLPGR